MRKTLLTVALLSASAFAFAQAPGGVQTKQGQATSGGVNIQGNTEINANAQNVNAVATGEGNTAKNAVGSIKSGTNIKGNTKINANAKNVNAIASGRGNKATNEVGVVGGKD